MRITTAIAFIVALSTTARAEDDTKDAFATFKTYLEKNHKGKKWQFGPAKIESKELKAAYPDLSFQYVWSSPPLPPGAPLKELIERYRAAAEDFNKNCISVTVAVGKDGIRPLSQPADFGKGLMAIKNEDDAKTAAAAILSLYPGRGQGTGQMAVGTDLVKVEKTEKGWTCVATKLNNFQGTVTFDADGKVLSVSKQSIAPLPPSARPR